LDAGTRLRNDITPTKPTCSAEESREANIKEMDVLPCFRCFFSEELKTRTCNPICCSELEEFLNILSNERVRCQYCGSFDVVHNGVRKRKDGSIRSSRYRCKDCTRQTIISDNFQFKMKHEKKVVDFAIRLSKSLDPAYSSRDLSKLIAQTYGLKVSHVTVNRWIQSSFSSI
jgi:transposase-like protein